jgi:sugar/nucleoside kinase (ribokinase family)
MARNAPNKLFWVDSRHRIDRFTGMVIKPNQHEAVRSAFPDHTGPLDDDLVIEAGRRLSASTGKPIFLTRGERGMIVFDGAECQAVRGVHIEGPTDPTGAGDSATASAVLTLASGGTLREAALVANLVGSITVQQLGVTGTARPEDLPARLNLWESQGESK